MDEHSLTFVVNGEDVIVKVAPQKPLHAARNQALAQSRNTGRPPDDWELRTLAGVLISDLSRAVSSYGFQPDERLFLTLKVGAGGADAD